MKNLLKNINKLAFLPVKKPNWLHTFKNNASETKLKTFENGPSLYKTNNYLIKFLSIQKRLFSYGKKAPIKARIVKTQTGATVAESFVSKTPPENKETSTALKKPKLNFNTTNITESFGRAINKLKTKVDELKKAKLPQENKVNDPLFLDQSQCKKCKDLKTVKDDFNSLLAVKNGSFKQSEKRG